MRLRDVPSADYAFAYRDLPPSGNAINGLGEAQRRRPRSIFHGTGGEVLEWSALDRLFVALNTWAAMWATVRNLWVLRDANGPVAERQVPVDDPSAMAASIKQKGRDFGADLVGVTPLVEEHVFEGRDIRYKNAICLGFAMDRDAMAGVPDRRANREVMESYVRSSKTAVRLAAHIRSLGWPARAYGLNCNDIQQLPLAIKAGLGQLGKHGSLICLEHGSNLRLSTVLTDMPLPHDVPVDIGVDDLCRTCRRCTIDCPPAAIGDAKQLVRGETKWYVDFDKCAPYFAKTWGCGICIEVCPWSEPGQGPRLSEKLLSKRMAADAQNTGAAAPRE
ncbi:MAG: 4Fe-4S dicluster domain-containing protein [Bauldia litoralis]